MEDFNGFGFSEQILKNLKEKNYTKPTEVQCGAIPIILANRDLVIQSHTGSGKTASFGLPLIQKVMVDVPAVQFLVMVPTRELAAQVGEELASLAKDTGVSVCSIYGGSDMKRQVKALEKGAQLVIGTPGRILDHLKRRTMSFSVVRGVVLDESDKMLSMGFLPDVQLIFRHLPKRRQMVMSSATFPYSVEQLIFSYMEEPEKLMLSSDDRAPKEIEHLYCTVSNEDKERILLGLIEKEQPELSLVFCNTKMDVKSVHFFLAKAGLKAESMSSELSQSQRERVLKKLKMGQVQHLVCTDLAARGIHIPALSHVFLFSASNDAETYVHRTGRTGRAGQSGRAISLVSTLDLAGFLGGLRTNGIEAREIAVPTEEEIIDARMNNLYQHLVSIDFAKDTDTREEYEKVAARLTADQARSLLPLLLEHFLRPETLQPEEPQIQPPKDTDEPYEQSESGRDGDRGRSRDRGRDRGRGRDGGRDSRGRDSGGRGRDQDRSRGRESRDREPGTRDREVAGPAPRETTGSREGAPREPASRDREVRPPVNRDREPRGRERDSRDRRPPRDDRFQDPTDSRKKSESFTRVCMGLGRLDGLDEMDLQSILRRQGRVRQDDIGEIKMKDHESFVEIGNESLANALSADGKHFKNFELFIVKSPEAGDKELLLEKA